MPWGWLGAVLLLGSAGFYGASHWDSVGGSDQDQPLTATAFRDTLRVIVTENGNLESCKTVDGVCEVEGHQNKIIFIVAEGDTVKAGDVVVRFDSAELDRTIAQQEVKVKQAETKVLTTEKEAAVQKNKGQSEIAEAQLELDLAQLDLEKYELGDYDVSVNDLKSAIALAEADLEEAEDMQANLETLVKKGFKTPEQLRAQRQKVIEARFRWERDKRKLKVLQDYEHRRKLTELKAKADQAVKKLERAKANAEAQDAKWASEHEAARATCALEKQQLDRHLEQKQKCEITAKQDGVVAYANQPWYDSSRQIREGAMVHFRQKIFSLPDMSAMQVKVNVHESKVKKVNVGQTAEIRVEAFPNLLLTGTVKSVSPLADSNRSWLHGGVKEYSTVVTIDKMPDEQLKPGMSAEVKILVNEIPIALLVPVQAVTEHEHEQFAYVKTSDGFARTNVTIGDSDQKLVEILQGLSDGAVVALDARARGLQEAQERGSAPDLAVAGKPRDKEEPTTTPKKGEANRQKPLKSKGQKNGSSE